VQQLEQEVKLDPNPGWSLPDLSGVLPGVEVHTLPDVALETTYYDTADLRLARHHLTLRFRRQTELVPGPRRVDHPSTTEVWTVKLPTSSDSTLLARTEVTWPGEGVAGVPTGRRSSRRPRATGRGLQNTGYEFEKVHPEAAQFVQAAALGRPLEPVAHLSSIRRRTELRTSDGRPLAEIDEDTITGRDLLANQERPLKHGDSPDVRFREVEAELAEGSALEVLTAVVERLETAGARRSPGKSKLARVLAGGSPEVDLADLSRQATETRAQETAMSGVLREQARSCLDTLIDHDPAIRLDDSGPEHIHRSRVATRRLRTILREFAPLVTYGPEDQVAYSPGHQAGNQAGNQAEDNPGDATNAAEAWFGTLMGELKWLGGILGAVRDSDVRLQSLEQHCAQLPAVDAAAGEILLEAARDERRGRHEELRDAMAKSRYLDVLRALDALASGPAARSHVPNELWALLSEPAAAGMPALAHRQWRSVRKAVRRLAPEPADEALHRVRIETKRLRYLAEVAAPVIRPATHRDAAAATAKAATALQDILGDLHDAVVTEAWLRQTAYLADRSVEAASLIATGLAAGELIGVERETQRKSRAAWLGAWRRLDRKGLRAWATDGQSPPR
jgi:CHAD domain-containing protein